MLCVRSDGSVFSHNGTSCPTGTTEYSSGAGADTGAKTADGKSIPGTADRRPVAVGFYSAGRGGMGPGSSVYQEAMDFEQLRVLNPAGYRQIVNQLRDAGLISSRVTSPTAIADVYRTVLEASAQTVEMGQPQTPQQLLEQLSTGQAAVEEADTGARAGAGAGSYAGPRSRVDLTNETTAYTLLNTAARDMIGRDLTEEEIRKYTRQLNRIEMQSGTTATQVGPGLTVTTGGVDRGEVVRQLISDNPEFAGYQLNHQIMDTILADIDEGQAFLNEWS